MPLSNTPTSYGSLSRTLHWLTALLIFTAIGLSFLMDDGPFTNGAEAARATLFFSLHKTVGVAAFFVALARILWGLFQPRPGLLNPDRRLETLLAELVHWSLYGAMVIMPLSGWIAHAATTGFAPIYWPFGQSLPLLPKSENLGHLFLRLHVLAHLVLYATIALHVLGAFKHALLDRDATLARMLSGADVPVPPQRPSFLPVILACAGWTFVFALAFATARTAPQIATGSGQTSATAAGNWAVADASLAFTVTLMGQPVSGNLAGWTSDITYDEAAKTGTVTVTLPLSGLTLGSVTQQAAAPEFLDIANYPTATFKADIAQTDGALTANGTLNLHGQERPVALPFTLAIDGDTARMTGQTTLDRRDFAIGTSYPDQNTVGFAVTIDVALNAARR